MLYVTLYGVPWMTGESSMDTPCWESGSRDSLIVVFNSVSFWEDKDGLTVASVSIHLYFSGGRAVGSLTINTSLFAASCAVSPSPTWLDRDFLIRGFSRCNGKCLCVWPYDLGTRLLVFSLIVKTYYHWGLSSVLIQVEAKIELLPYHYPSAIPVYDLDIVVHPRAPLHHLLQIELCWDSIAGIVMSNK